MNYLKNMAVAVVFVVASIVSAGFASAVTVNSMGFDAFAVSGNTGSLTATPTLNIVAGNPTTSATYELLEAGSIIGFKFGNFDIATKYLEVSLIYSAIQNAPSFVTWWAEDAIGSVPLLGAATSGSDANQTMGIIEFAQNTVAYLFVQYNGPQAEYLDYSSSESFSVRVLANGPSAASAPAVPLPPSLVLFGTGLLGVGFLSMRRRRKATSV